MENLEDFLKKRHRVLIRRDLGGFGDILMHRMMFESFKRAAPQIELSFACPTKFVPVVEDHPFLDKVIDVNDVNELHYAIVYNTSRSCITYELAKAPYVDKHRSDIWANFCGMSLDSHKMHISFTNSELDEIDAYLVEHNVKQPFVLIAPATAMQSKNLSPNQCHLSEKRLEELGFCVCYLHDRPLEHGKTLTGLSTRLFMAVISKAAMVISADTAAFHCAGGLGVPLVAVFGWADGKVYGKYFPNMILVQKHRDDGSWKCGPCFYFTSCPKEPEAKKKPCITELTAEDIWTGVSKCLQQIL